MLTARCESADLLIVSASRDPLSPIGSSVAGGVGGSMSLAGWEGLKVEVIICFARGWHGVDLGVQCVLEKGPLGGVLHLRCDGDGSSCV